MSSKKRTAAEERMVDRRGFLIGVGASAAGSLAAVAQAAEDPKGAAVPKWDMEADVVVVGSGAAACVAAAKAIDSKATVIVVEKAPIWGGTTAKSGAWYWIPNNSLMRKLGMADPRDEAVRYMARMSFPVQYRPQAPNLGLSQRDYDLLTTFYDRAAEAVDDLARMGAMESQFVGGPKPIVYDYGAALPENKAPIGRGLQPKGGETAGGIVMTRTLRKFITSKGGKTLLSHRAMNVVRNSAHEVVGLTVQSPDGLKTIRARRGVVFGSGGFTHNVAYREAFLRGPVFGGCAVPTNEGDFLRIGMELGADLGNRENAWWGECVLEEGLKNPSFGATLFIPPGRSMFYVNRFGRRVVDEHMVYNERTQAHFVWDPNRYEFTNNVLIMMFDEATRTENAGWYPIPAAGVSPPHLLQGDTFESLAQAIDQRLKELSPKIGPIRLDSAFVQNLKETEQRFAKFAAAGKDADFRRGCNVAGRLLALGEIDPTVVFSTDKAESLIDPALVKLAEKPKAAVVIDPEAPNNSMRAFSGGPYYALLIGGGTLDTKGGPRINTRAEVLDSQGKAIAGLYGAGNCIASPAAATYHAPGGTIGFALAYGYIAGEQAAKAPIKNV